MERKRRIWGFLLVSGWTWLVYFISTAPTVVFWDVGEFLAVAANFGIPHPPGTPFMVILGRFLGLLPLPLAPLYTLLTGYEANNFVLKVTQISMLPGALSAGLLYLIALEVMDRWPGMDRLPWGVRHASAAAGALLGMFAATVWKNSIEAETYTPTFFTLVLIIWMGFKFWDARDSRKGLAYLILMPYVFVLSAGIHMSIVPFLLGYVVLILLVRRDLLLNLDTIAALGLGLAFLTTLYFPYEFTPRLAVVHGGALGAAFWVLTRRSRRLETPWVALFFAGVALQFLARTHATLVLAGYVITLAGYYLQTRFWRDWKGIALLMVLLAFTPQFFLISRAYYLHFHPNAAWINEADPWNWQAFMDVLTRKQYGPTEFFPRRIPWVDQLRVLHLYLSWQFPPLLFLPLMLLALWGAVESYLRDRRTFLYVTTFTLIASLGMLFLLNLRDSPTAPVSPGNPTEVRDRDYFYAYFYSLLGVYWAFAFAGLLELAFRHAQGVLRRLVSAAGYAVMAGLVVGQMAMTWPYVHRQGNYIAEDYGYNLLISPSTGGVLFTNGDNDTFPLWFLQEAMGFRKDIIIANLSLLNTNWYVRQLKAWGAPISFTDEEIDRLPPAMLLGRDRVVFLRDLAIRDMIATSTGWRDSLDPEDFVEVRGVPIPKLYFASMEVFRDSVLRGRTLRVPIYFSITCSPEVYQGLESFFLMDGMVFALTSTEQPMIAMSLYRMEAVDAEETHRHLHDGMPPLEFFAEYSERVHPDSAVWRYRGIFKQDLYKDDTHLKLAVNYANVAIRLGFYHAVIREDYARAIEMLEVARRFYTQTQRELPERFLRQGEMLRQQMIAFAREGGLYDRVIALAQEALAEGGGPEYRLAIAQAYEAMGKTEEAIRILEEIRLEVPQFREAIWLLSQLYAERGDTERAIQVVQQYLREPSRDPRGDAQIRAWLNTLRGGEP